MGVCKAYLVALVFALLAPLPRGPASPNRPFLSVLSLCSLAWQLAAVLAPTWRACHAPLARNLCWSARPCWPKITLKKTHFSGGIAFTFGGYVEIFVLMQLLLLGTLQLTRRWDAGASESANLPLRWAMLSFVDRIRVMGRPAYHSGGGGRGAVDRGILRVHAATPVPGSARQTFARNILPSALLLALARFVATALLWMLCRTQLVGEPSISGKMLRTSSTRRRLCISQPCCLHPLPDTSLLNGWAGQALCEQPVSMPRIIGGSLPNRKRAVC